EILSEVDSSTLARGRAGGGGLGAGVTNTSVFATTSPDVLTYVGATANMTASGDIDVTTLLFTSADASASAMQFGLGAASGTVNVLSTVDATVDTDIRTGAFVSSTGGDVSLLSGHNYNDATGQFIPLKGVRASSES